MSAMLYESADTHNTHNTRNTHTMYVIHSRNTHHDNTVRHGTESRPPDSPSCEQPLLPYLQAHITLLETRLSRFSSIFHLSFTFPEGKHKGTSVFHFRGREAQNCRVKRNVLLSILMRQVVSDLLHTSVPSAFCFYYLYPYTGRGSGEDFAHCGRGCFFSSLFLVRSEQCVLGLYSSIYVQTGKYKVWITDATAH